MKRSIRIVNREFKIVAKASEKYREFPEYIVRLARSGISRSYIEHRYTGSKAIRLGSSCVVFRSIAFQGVADLEAEMPRS